MGGRGNKMALPEGARTCTFIYILCTFISTCTLFTYACFSRMTMDHGPLWNRMEISNGLSYLGHIKKVNFPGRGFFISSPTFENITHQFKSSMKDCACSRPTNTPLTNGGVIDCSGAFLFRVTGARILLVGTHADKFNEADAKERCNQVLQQVWYDAIHARCFGGFFKCFWKSQA